MKKVYFPVSKLVVVFFLSLILMTGCITINLPPEPTSTPAATGTQPPVIINTPLPTEVRPKLTDEVLKNSEYISPVLQSPITLVNGSFDGVVDGTELHAAILPEIQYGDLNRDGIDDAAFLLSENTGGSGVFVSLVVVYSTGNQFQQAPGLPIDDRPVIDGMTIANGVVNLNGLVHGINDTMIDPTTRIYSEWKLLGGRLVQTRLISSVKGGAEHIIYIDSPADGAFVSGSVQVKGRMPIAPFENNLSLVITDPLTGQLLHEGFMVQAADMGLPATFDNTIQLPQIAPGTQVLLSLSEVSMADGSPIAIASVLLTVQ